MRPAQQSFYVNLRKTRTVLSVCLKRLWRLSGTRAHSLSSGELLLCFCWLNVVDPHAQPQESTWQLFMATSLELIMTMTPLEAENTYLTDLVTCLLAVKRTRDFYVQNIGRVYLYFRIKRSFEMLTCRIYELLKLTLFWAQWHFICCIVLPLEIWHYRSPVCSKVKWWMYSQRL